MITNRPLRVFLCHSSTDKPAVRDLYDKLTARGIDAWLDEKKLIPGQPWKIEIPKAVREADAVIICLSKTSITKEGYVQKEIKFALDIALEKPEGTIYLIPARLEECKVPDSLSDWHWVNLFESQGIDFLFKSLELRANSLAITLKPLEPQRIDDIMLFDEAMKIVREQGQISTSILQRKLRISFTRSSHILSMMEDKGVIGQPVGGTQMRQVLVPQTAPIRIATSKVTDKNKLTLSNGMEFMRVPAGKFLMGSNNGADSEKPQHTVDIPYEYWMARFPITNEQYNIYVKAKRISHPVSGWEKKKDHPVVNVSWDTVMEYCQWLNNLFKAKLSLGTMLRLPSEAEWEKAASGTKGREYPWGNTFDKNKCNSKEGGKGGTTSVGSYSPHGDSPYGCADMAGNVWEWTHTEPKVYLYNVKDGREDKKKIVARVIRGGAYGNRSGYLRCTFRDKNFPNDIRNDQGFRVVVASSLISL